jgi:hypothetical protein
MSEAPEYETMPMTPIAPLNVSRVQDHLKCQVFEHLKWRLKRQKRSVSVPLVLGQAWHAAAAVVLEARALGPPVDLTKAYEAGMAVIESVDRSAMREEDEHDLDQGAALLLDRLLLYLPGQIPDDWKVLIVEEPIEGHLQVEPSYPALHLRGRPDALVVWNGKLWHLQHKTAALSVSWPLFERGIQRSWHENAYLALLTGRHDLLERAAVLAGVPSIPIGGTLLLGVKKAAKLSKENPEACFHKAYLGVIPHAMKQAVISLQVLGHSINQRDVLFANDVPFPILENRASCLGTFNNMPCPYLDVCDGKASLNDDVLFATVDPLEAYHDTPTG